MVSTTVWAGVGGLLLLAVVGVVGALHLRRESEPVTVDDIVARSGEVVEFRAPDTSGTLMGLWKMYRHRSRAQKLARKGYVKWYKIGSNVSRPKWVKPEQAGSGVPRYRKSGETYYFPREAMVTDSETGAYVAMHYEGDADPINLRDSDLPALSTDKVERVINMEAESDAPGFLSGLDLSPSQIMTGLIVLIVVYGAFTQFM